MSSENFEPGVVVELKSGGPAMTISQIEERENKSRDCGLVWFVDDAPRYANLNSVVLKISTPGRVTTSRDKPEEKSLFGGATA
jgi:uncharacterized protein YodC (DUF2158 family)